MLKVTPEKDRIVRLEAAGRITPREMEDGIERLLALSDDMPSMRLLYIVAPDFVMPGADALRVELRHVTRLWGLLRKMDRAALVCGIGWVRAAAAVESLLIPGLEIRNFDAGEVEAARTWLRGEDA